MLAAAGSCILGRPWRLPFFAHTSRQPLQFVGPYPGGDFFPLHSFVCVSFLPSWTARCWPFVVPGPPSFLCATRSPPTRHCHLPQASGLSLGFRFGAKSQARATSDLVRLMARVARYRREPARYLSFASHQYWPSPFSSGLCSWTLRRRRFIVGRNAFRDWGPSHSTPWVVSLSRCLVFRALCRRVSLTLSALPDPAFGTFPLSPL